MRSTRSSERASSAACSLGRRRRATCGARGALATSLALSRLEAGAVSSEPLHGLSGGVRSLAFERDLLVSGTKDNLGRLWGCRTLGTCFAEHLHPQWVGAVALTVAAGGLLATGCDDGRIRVWSTDATSRDAAPLELKGHSDSWIQGWAQGVYPAKSRHHGCSYVLYVLEYGTCAADASCNASVATRTTMRLRWSSSPRVARGRLAHVAGG